MKRMKLAHKVFIYDRKYMFEHKKVFKFENINSIRGGG
jgi:hypothetical protein